MSQTAEICMSRTKNINIPEGVVMEILSWLPVKSLLRFKCVSKTWYQLISTDSVFINLHLDRSKNRNPNPGIIVSQRYWIGRRDRIYFAEDPTTETQDAICFKIPVLSRGLRSLVNVCNGLVCFTDGDLPVDNNVYVWNPFTGDHIIIPVPPFRSLFSFGFHQGSNEYKILRIVARDFEVPHLSDVWVYTLGTHSWRNLGDIMDYDIRGRVLPSTAIVNGALHWIGCKRRPVYIPNVLVSFDFGDEIFQEIPQPNYGEFDGGAGEDQIMYTVGELSGLLCIFRCLRLSNTKMEIWMMKEYGVVDSWAKQYIVFDVRDYNLPFCVAHNEEIILPNYELDCQLILYNPKTNSIRRLNKFGFVVCNINNYIGSLQSPTMINERRHSSTEKKEVCNITS